MMQRKVERTEQKHKIEMPEPEPDRPPDVGLSEQQLPNNVSDFITSAETAELRHEMGNLPFDQVLEFIQPWSMVDRDSLHYIYNAVGRVNAQKIEGDVIEVGVWK